LHVPLFFLRRCFFDWFCVFSRRLDEPRDLLKPSWPDREAQ
jgi:hypothetical protein